MTKKIEWLYAWHAILDREFGPNPNAPKNGKLEDVYPDFRMNFQTWGLSHAAMRECFEMLPRGDEIADRILDKDAWSSNLNLSNAEAKQQLRDAIRGVSHFLDPGVSENDPIRMMRGSEKEMKALGVEDALPYELIFEDLLENLPGKFDAEQGAACQLLSETLYQRRTLYEGVEFALWPYYSIDIDVDLFKILLQNRQSPFYWLKDEGGLIVFFNEDETINDSADIELAYDACGYHNISSPLNDAIAGIIQSQKARGFPDRRFETFSMGLYHDEGYRIVLRPISNPDTAQPNEKPYTGRLHAVGGKVKVDPGMGLFFHKIDASEGPQTITMSLHNHV